MKPTTNDKLMGLLAARGIPSILCLAKMLNCGRASLNLVLIGERTGKPTWRKLESILTVEEFKAAKEFSDSRLAELPARIEERKQRKLERVA